MEIEFVADAAEEQAREVDRGLDEYNAGFVPDGSAAPVRAVFLESGSTVAGLNGVAYWRKVHVSILWVHPNHRSKGLGSRLMSWVEERGRELGCVSVVVDTMSFQAPDFYVRLGYRQFGLSEGYEGGASRYYFEKKL